MAEYFVAVTVTETYHVFVEADSPEEATVSAHECVDYARRYPGLGVASARRGEHVQYQGATYHSDDPERTE